MEPYFTPTSGRFIDLKASGIIVNFDGQIYGKLHKGISSYPWSGEKVFTKYKIYKRLVSRIYIKKLLHVNKRQIAQYKNKGNT